MNGVDTNIIGRFLTGDDPGQSEKARAVLKRSDIFVAEMVMLEVEWVLRHAYSLRQTRRAARYFPTTESSFARQRDGANAW